MRGCAAFEPLNDKHGAATARAGTALRLRLLGAGGGSLDCIDGKDGQREQLAGARDIVRTLTASEQAIVADAMEARWQHMHEEPTDELVRRERHHLVTRGTVEPVVLPFEGNVLVIVCDQAAVRDGDPVGIAGEIAQDFLGPAEGSLAVDDPFAVAQWCQIGGERFRIAELGMLAEELQLAEVVGGGELLQEQVTEQGGENRHREEIAGSTEDPTPAAERAAGARPTR